MENREPRQRARQPGRVSASRPFWEWTSLLELVTGLLAIAIVVFTGAVLWVPLTSGAPDAVTRAQAIMALLGPILGAVVGYYFGTASGERVARQADQRAEAAVEEKVQSERLSDEALAVARALIERTQQALLRLHAAEQPPQ